MRNKWCIEHPDEWAKIQSKTGKERRIKMKTEIFALLGNRCSNSKCLVPDGCLDPRCLQIDHVNGDGKKERTQKGAGLDENHLKYILQKIKAGSKNYQLLCANCNWIKRHENREQGGRNKKCI